MRTDTETIIKALRVLALQFGDGVVNAAIAEAADRLQEQHNQLAGLRDPETMRANLLRGLVVLPSGYGETGMLNERIKRLEEAGDKLIRFYCPSTLREKVWESAKQSKP